MFVTRKLTRDLFAVANLVLLRWCNCWPGSAWLDHCATSKQSD